MPRSPEKPSSNSRLNRSEHVIVCKIFGQFMGSTRAGDGGGGFGDVRNQDHRLFFSFFRAGHNMFWLLVWNP